MNNIYSIKNLALKNFKCYDSAEHFIEFGNDLTVIIGQNGAGKTVLLNAVKKAVSIILARDRRKGVNFIGDALNIRQNTIKNEDARYNFDFSEGGEDYEFPVVLTCNGNIRGNEMEWYIEKQYKGHRSGMTFREALDVFLAPLNDGTTYPKYPILCFFSDCFPHVRSDLAKYEKDILYNKAENPERRAGYYHWDEDSTDFYFWTAMFINAYKKLNDTVLGVIATEKLLAQTSQNDKNHQVLVRRMEGLARAQKEIDYVSGILKDFTHAIQNYDNESIEIESISVGHYINNAGKEVDSLKIAFCNGEYRYFDMLPEGHKRLFSIVFEIAYRHYVLNRKLVLDDATCSPEGIVIIDEVELHLHPSLAEEVIQRLRRTFPNVQFIVTTHSPMIVSNVYNDGQQVRVLRLNRNHEFILAEDCFEAEYSDTLVMAMGAYNSMRYIQILRQRYLDAVTQKNEEEMLSVRQDLMTFIGNVENVGNVAEGILNDWRELL